MQDDLRAQWNWESLFFILGGTKDKVAPPKPPLLDLDL